MTETTSTDTRPVRRWLDTRRTNANTALRRVTWLAPIIGTAVVAQAWIIAYAIDAVIFHEAGITELAPYLLALPPVFIVRFVAAWQAERQAFLGAQRVKQQLRTELFDRLRQLGPVNLSMERSGSLAGTLVEGVESIGPYFASYLPAMTMASVVPLVILLAVFPGDWLSGLVLLLTAPLIPVFMILIGKGAERINQRQWQHLARMGGHFLDVIQGLTTLKLFNASRRELDNIASISDEFRRSTMAVLRVAFLTSAVLEFFAAISIALIAVLIGFRLLDGEMDFIYGFFVLLLAPEFYMPLRNLGSQNHARLEAVGAAEDMVRLLGTEQQGSSRPDHEQAPERHSRAGPTSPTASGDIVLDDVWFSYPDGRTALHGTTIRIPAGQHTAIIGESGAGKSTLANLLLGFIRADRGTIRIGETALEDLSPEHWRKLISWIPQRPRLFHGSVADNIALGLPDADADAIRNAARHALALPFIERLPRRFETIIGEGGQGLSGGQAQRIAIARALLRDTPYLLLDEPTAHLDHDSERLVLQALGNLTRGRTVISIAHRPATLAQADQVIVLKAGRVAEYGNPDEPRTIETSVTPPVNGDRS